jgi:hypothetical protein
MFELVNLKIVDSSFSSWLDTSMEKVVTYNKISNFQSFDLIEFK